MQGKRKKGEMISTKPFRNSYYLILHSASPTSTTTSPLLQSQKPWPCTTQTQKPPKPSLTLPPETKKPHQPSKTTTGPPIICCRATISSSTNQHQLAATSSPETPLHNYHLHLPKLLFKLGLHLMYKRRRKQIQFLTETPCCC